MAEKDSLSKNSLILIAGFVLTGSMPWIERVSSLRLISDYFRAVLDPVAAAAGLAVYGWLTPAWCRGIQSHAIFKRRLLICFVIFLVSFLACLMFKFSIGLIWFPGKVLTVVIWVIWHIAYLSWFQNPP